MNRIIARLNKTANYNYEKAIEKDIENVLDEYDIDWSEDIDDIIDDLYDKLFIDDSVTGNGSGSYTFNREEAYENLQGNYQLAKDMAEEFGENTDQKIMDYCEKYDLFTEDGECDEDEFFHDNAEHYDVTIRCGLLYEYLRKMIERIYNEKK